ADLGVSAHGKRAKHLAARGDDDVVFDGGVALADVFAGAAERCALVNGHIVAHNGGLADYHAHAVVDEHALANDRAGVDLNAGKMPGKLRNDAGKELAMM